MHINPVGNGPVAGTPGPQGQGKARGAQEDSAPSGGNSIRPGPGAHGNANGVIRLLQEGHFKGVSGVRLQINFHEQLAAITQQSTASAADTGAEAILAAVDAVVADFTANNDLGESILEGITTAQQAFTDAATALSEEFRGGAIGGGQLLASLQAAFEDFLASIESLVPAGGAPSTEGDPVVTVTADEGGAQAVIPTGGEVIPLDLVTEDTGEPAPPPEPDYSAFIQALGDAFGSALLELEGALASAQSTVPEVSEPNGNGVAFAKFLNILNALNGGGEAVDTSTVDPEIDTAA